MFKLLMDIPRDVFVAVSGGPDSVAALDFLRRSHNVTAVHFFHGTEHGEYAKRFVTDLTEQMGVSLIVGEIENKKPNGMSKEDFWRQERYNFFKKVVRGTLVTAHTLDDAMETWIFTSLHGVPRLIPQARFLCSKEYFDGLKTYNRGNSAEIIRPFLLARKTEMVEWCQRKDIPFILDPGNVDLAYPRVRIRQDILPRLLIINPGFPKVISKKYLKENSDDG